MSFENVCTYKHTEVSSNWMVTLQQVDSNVYVLLFNVER